MPDLDVLSKLPEFEWRGKKYPTLESEYSFRHEDAEHKLSFGEVTIVEPLGPKNPTFRYTVSMRQGISRGPYENLFLKLGELEADCYDRTPGDLVDPIFGRWTVKPNEFRVRSTGTSQDGVDAEISFIWAPNLDEDVRGVAVSSIEDLRSEAGLLDATVEALGRKYDEPPPGPTINALDAPSAALGQVDRQVEKTRAQLDDFAYRVEKTERYAKKVIKLARDPDAFGLYRNCRRVRHSANRTKNEVVDLTANISQIVVGQATNLMTVAAENVMSVKEFLSLNPTLAAAPIIPADTTVNVYK